MRYRQAITTRARASSPSDVATRPLKEPSASVAGSTASTEATLTIQARPRGCGRSIGSRRATSSTPTAATSAATLRLFTDSPPEASTESTTAPSTPRTASPAATAEGTTTPTTPIPTANTAAVDAILTRNDWSPMAPLISTAYTKHAARNTTETTPRVARMPSKPTLGRSATARQTSAATPTPAPAAPP